MDLVRASDVIPKSTTLRESAVQILLAKIMSGDFSDGEIYSVSKIASLLGISPTPVREAVLELADKGLVTIQKNRGFIVPQLTKSEVEELHHIRVLLEVPSTVRAGMLMDAQTASEARAIGESTVESAHSGDLVTYVELDRKFHRTFLSPLAMPSLVRLIMDYRDRARLRGLSARLGSDEIVAAALEHSALTEAALARDEALLEKIITGHLEMTRLRSIAEFE